MPKQIRENGLAWADIRFQRSAILKLIRSYTMEAGVRNLEREIANVLRKIARDAVGKGLMPPASRSRARGAGRRRQPAGRGRGGETPAARRSAEACSCLGGRSSAPAPRPPAPAVQRVT